MKTFNIIQEARDYSVINPSETVEYKVYHKNGKLHMHCFYVNGLVHGESKTYYYSGQSHMHCFYVNGLDHGECKTYYSNGQPMFHRFYVNGEELDLDLDHLKDGSYKSLCIKHTLFNGNVI